MIINNYHTIEYIRENKDQDLNSENLLKIHKLITNKTLDNDQEEGTFRTNNDINIFNRHSREAVHIPPDFKEIPNLIDDLSNFFNSDDKSIHPIIKGIIIHFMIAWIHPFVDGNGRTARSLFYWYMLKNGYGFIQYLSISKIIAKSKSQYEKAYLYTENDDNDLNYFIIYNLKTIKKAFKSFKNYVGIKEEEKISILQMINKLGVNERQGYLIKKVYENPDIVFTVKEIEKRFSVSNFTARADLAGLVKKGFIEPIAVNKTKRIYIKSKDFDKLVNIN
nr:Fic family protein [Methanobrevibacter sp. TMH8]